MNNETGFFQRKTTWTALLTIFGAVAGAITGNVSIPEAAQLTVTALLGLTIRSAINAK
jgi:hypothetical protein